MLGQGTGGGLQLGAVGLGGGGLKLGTGLGQQGLGLGGTSTATGGLQLGGLSTGTGLGLGQTGGLGTGTGLTLGGLGTSQGSTGLVANKPGTGLGLGLGGLGMGGLGTGLQLSQQQTGLGLGGLSQARSSSIAGTTGQGIFSQSTFHQQQQSQQSALAQTKKADMTVNAVKCPAVFPNDERDRVLTKFNMIQASAGTGTGLVNYEGQIQSVDFSIDNLLCRFKTICYSQLPLSKNEDGLVALHFNKKHSQLLTEQEAVAKTLQDLVNTPSVQVMVDGVRPLPDDCSEMTVYLLEKSVMGGSRCLLAGDVYMFLQKNIAQLQKAGVSHIYPRTGFSEENLRLYLQHPPAGITTQLWEQSKKDNPNPKKFIPVPVVGSAALHRRMKLQEQECSQQQSRLEILTEEIGQLQQSHTTMVAKIAERKRQLLLLSHRVLKVMVAQETLRKSGYSIQPEEEKLRIRLEGIQVELDAPLQFKGRLNELMSQLRMQTQVPAAKADSRFSLDPILLDEIRQHLHQQQGALSQLVKIIKEDFEDLKCIEDGFSQT